MTWNYEQLFMLFGTWRLHTRARARTHTYREAGPSMPIHFMRPTHKTTALSINQAVYVSIWMYAYGHGICRDTLVTRCTVQYNTSGMPPLSLGICQDSHTLHFHPSFLSTRLHANIIRNTHPHATRTAQHIWGAAVITLCVLNIYIYIYMYIYIY